MDLSGKRLLILGGSRISCEIIKHARRMGIVTGVTDWYPIKKCPAKQEADEAYFVNTSDIDAMVKLIKEKHFDGVITGFTDSVLPYYAEMCEKAGVRSYGTKEQFDIFIDKQKYKELLRKFNVPTIPEYQIDVDRFDETAVDVVFPVLVKPVDSSGSRGITICNNMGELKTAILLATEVSKVKRALVEQYIDGAEATVFWLFVEGKYYMMLLGNRHVKHNQEGVLPLPVGYTYPASVQPKFLAEVAPKIEKMFHYVGIKNGMMFMQCKIVNSLCVVYDIGYRLTGSLEYINIKEMCGFDPLDMMISFVLTGNNGEPDIEKKVDPCLGGKYSYNVSLLSKPGKIAQIKGLDEIRALPGVIEAVVAHPEGDEITPAMKGRLAQISIRVLGKADTIEHMKQEMLLIHNHAHIISDRGEELLLSGLEELDFEGTVYEAREIDR
ncbi:ATP-grasp domain-containing protein [Hungatella effluvii]|uniref:ATP-grasp domain-containing protein n=1 Tax=Hungatella effluvii TaxID=1096246 RepID=UPI0022E02A3B|nr:ATP-grasp domain-containing protein [Hungatella effluvii]